MVCMPAAGFSHMEPKGIANMYTETPALGMDERLSRHPKRAILFNNGVHAGVKFFQYGVSYRRHFWAAYLRDPSVAQVSG